MSQIDPKKDWSYHSYRDSDIETYISAIKYLISVNYVVLRIGSEYSKKLNFNNNEYELPPMSLLKNK